MSDPADSMGGIAEHVGLAGGPAVILGIIQRWFHSAAQNKLETTLAVLVAKVDEIAKAQAKHDSYGERLALAEQSVKACHDRLDGLQRGRRK